MTIFETPSVDDLPDDIRERIEAETEQAGFTPNVFPAMAYRPSHFRAFVDYYDALLEETTLERPEIEMIVLAVSGLNGCHYCQVSHGAMLRVYGDDKFLAEQIASNHRIADIGDEHTAMLDFAVKLTEHPGQVGRDDIAALRDAGFTQMEIWDIGSVVSFYNLSNRMATLTDMQPNEEFYDMGR